jgi:micrococcal nuclease
MYEYSAEVLRVVDGDTIHARLDLGIDVHHDLVLRLAYLNAPEVPSIEGLAAKTWLIARLAKVNNMVTVHTVKDKREKYGRYLASLFDGDRNINVEMMDAGQAFPYDGHGPKPTGGT